MFPYIYFWLEVKTLAFSARENPAQCSTGLPPPRRPITPPQWPTARPFPFPCVRGIHRDKTLSRAYPVCITQSYHCKAVSGKCTVVSVGIVNGVNWVSEAAQIKRAPSESIEILNVLVTSCRQLGISCFGLMPVCAGVG